MKHPAQPLAALAAILALWSFAPQQASATMAGGCYPPSHPQCQAEQRAREAKARHEAQVQAERNRQAREQRAQQEAQRRAQMEQQRRAYEEQQRRAQMQRQQQLQQQQYGYQNNQQQQQRRNKYGSLAVDYGQGRAYGWAVNFDNQASADNYAQSQCGGRCSVVMRFANTCAAYSVDQSQGSTATGWATAPSVGQAQNAATQYCQSRGGRYCQTRVWGCAGA